MKDSFAFLIAAEASDPEMDEFLRRARQADATRSGGWFPVSEIAEQQAADALAQQRIEEAQRAAAAAAAAAAQAAALKGGGS